MHDLHICMLCISSNLIEIIWLYFVAPLHLTQQARHAHRSNFVNAHGVARATKVPFFLLSQLILHEIMFLIYAILLHLSIVYE